ncbi:hypothetical protein [Blastomonas sp. AAP53]|uniref:hypothetical protein n=1 Tax=Blastomonas sp. AAP53 TaxID=1248760 RepID=UPI0012670AB0|nr:hypothetical protein [Blastomonas sp. AAP53]
MKGTFTCSYGLAGTPLAMDMNFPHDAVGQARSGAARLRTLDMDILRALASTPMMACMGRRPLVVESLDPDQAMTSWMAGLARADGVTPGSFNRHFVDALNQLAPAEQICESGVYHCASGNRKAAGLDSPHAHLCTNQAF